MINQDIFLDKKGGVTFKDMKFKILFVQKNHNSTGLQLADLLARPIGLNILKPNQQNRAVKIFLKKYHPKFPNITLE